MLYDQISSHDFAMIPRADIPRSMFKMRHTHKTTFDAGYLVPIYCEELMPGDSYKGVMHCMARLATPIVPFMDKLLRKCSNVITHFLFSIEIGRAHV